MALLQHGVRVQERATSIVAPVLGTAGLQVIFGTAPVNLTDDPYSKTNKPIIAYSWSEAVSQLGYSEELDTIGHYRYTLCASMYLNFQLFAVAPVIFVNVLDPTKHKKKNDTKTAEVVDMEATIRTTGILLDTVEVSTQVQTGAGEGGADIPAKKLTNGTDYVLSFDDDGYLVITLVATGAGATAKGLSVESTSIDPTAVDESDVIGASATGGEKGMEVLRQIYPRLGMTPGLILAPGWSHIPDVGIVLAAKCVEINGYFSCECFVDIDSREGHCTSYSGVKVAKEAAGCTSIHTMALWPCIQVGSKKFWYSAVMGAVTAYMDATNDDVPNLSPSNRLIGITGTVLADAVYTKAEDGSGSWDKEVLLDQLQGNAVNSFGVTTAINNNGWRTWGNRTAAYSSITDPKDMWFCCRRFFSWWGNSFILTYAQKVDNPANRRLIESIVDTENIRGSSYVPDKCAGIRIEYIPEENAITDLIDGHLKFHQYLAPYVPAEDILNTLEFDVNALQEALNGG